MTSFFTVRSGTGVDNTTYIESGLARSSGSLTDFMITGIDGTPNLLLLKGNGNHHFYTGDGDNTVVHLHSANYIMGFEANNTNGNFIYSGIEAVSGSVANLNITGMYGTPSLAQVSSTGAISGAGDIIAGAFGTSNHYARLALIGDTTYTSGGFIIERGNTGSNTTTTLTHYGTGICFFKTPQSGSFEFDVGVNSVLIINEIPATTVGSLNAFDLNRTKTITLASGTTLVGNRNRLGVTITEDTTFATLTGLNQRLAITGSTTLAHIFTGSTVGVQLGVSSHPAATIYATSNTAILSGTSSVGTLTLSDNFLTNTVTNTINVFYGILVRTAAVPIITTGAYGVRVNTLGAGANTWGIYIDVDQSYFGGFVGIGYDAPSFNLHIRSATNDYANLAGESYSTTNTTTTQFLCRKSHNNTVGTATTTVTGETIGLFTFQGVGNAGAWAHAAFIQAIQNGAATNATKVPTDLSFSTSDGTADPAVRLLINKDGAVSVGDTPATTDYKLQVYQSASQKMAARFMVNDADTGLGCNYGVMLRNVNATVGNYVSLSNMDSTETTNAWIDFINVAQNASTPKGAIRFITRNTTYASRLFITENGIILIGTETPLTYGSGVGPIAEMYRSGLTGADADSGTLGLFSNSTYGIDVGAGLVFASKYNVAGNYGTGARIRGAKENATSGNYSHYLAFDTRANGSNFAERMRITSAGKVGIGTTSPDVGLDVEAGLGNTNAKFGASGAIYLINSVPTIGFNAYFSSEWLFGAGSSANYCGLIDFSPTTGNFSIIRSSATGNADAAATMTTYGRINQEAWTAVTFSGTWANAIAGYSAAAYMKDSLGFVHLKGLIAGGTTGNTCFTLPSGYRPVQNGVYTAVYNDGTTYKAAYVDIASSTGVVTPVSGTLVGGWFSLETIIFKAA